MKPWTEPARGRLSALFGKLGLGDTGSLGPGDFPTIMVRVQELIEACEVAHALPATLLITPTALAGLYRTYQNAFKAQGFLKGVPRSMASYPTVDQALEAVEVWLSDAGPVAAALMGKR